MALCGEHSCIPEYQVSSVSLPMLPLSDLSPPGIVVSFLVLFWVFKSRMVSNVSFFPFHLQTLYIWFLFSHLI